MSASAKPGQSIRRSTRLPLEVPVFVSSLDPAISFSEPCNTNLVNAHGCGLIVMRAPSKGMRVQLEIVSAKRHTSARVAEVVPLGGDPETWLAGLELETPGNFWGIEFAPSDWKLEETKIEEARLEETKLEETKLEEMKSPAVKESSEPAATAPPKPARSQRWRISDLSAGACYLETAAPLPVGTSVLVSARTEGREYLLDGIVRVSHEQTGMGIELTPSPQQDQRAQVEELIAKLAADRDVPKIFVGRKEGRHTNGNTSGNADHSADRIFMPSALLETGSGIIGDTGPFDSLLDLIRYGAPLTPEQFLSDLCAQRLGKRRDPRISQALPVLITGLDAKGHPLEEEVMTVNISRRGALLNGVHGMLGPGQIAYLIRSQMKAQFRVAWVGKQNGQGVGQIGVAAVDPTTSFWKDVIETIAHSTIDPAVLRGHGGRPSL